MPELDISGKVAERAIAMTRILLKDLDTKLFAGPTGERLSKKEARERLASMTPEERTQLANSMGIDAFLAEAKALQDR